MFTQTQTHKTDTYINKHTQIRFCSQNVRFCASGIVGVHWILQIA